ncbi:protamine-like protein [Bombus bifarius]|uniref:Protamine-like protein n=1 Tax=Bombus bifarius TaxID=103933 RepID=A0A6P8MNX5_9HYME|nr:protamine-like protein [Bombus vancouverensis nearcticus]XP_033315501.1 protamine-like protein [Bombus bifarius]
MVSDSAKILALVVTAIKNLRELKGSTSREILHYLSSVYDISPNVARRQMQTALKRGVAYGILKKNGGCYILPTNSEINCQEIAEQEVNLLDVCRRNRMQKKLGCKCKKRRRRRRRRKRKLCRCRRRRRRRVRRRSRVCGRRRRRRKRKCRCGGLGRNLRRGDPDRTKRAGMPHAAENFPSGRLFEPSEAYDSAASEKTSLSSITSATD